MGREMETFSALWLFEFRNFWLLQKCSRGGLPKKATALGALHLNIHIQSPAI